MSELENIQTEDVSEKTDHQAHWYVVHTYSGHENKVKANIEKIVENRNMQDLILDIEVPTEETVSPATVTLAASATSLSALPKTTEEAALGTPAAPVSELVHIEASDQEPDPPFQV